MPYRRLPNTDAARIKAMKLAYSKAKELPPFKLAFSQSLFQRLQSFMPLFEKNVSESKQTYANKVNKSKDYQQALRKARLYISHFLQVMNMAIQRGEQQPAIREFFGIDPNNSRLPNLISEESVLEWGEKLIKGEQERIKRGMTPVTNPTIAVVRVRYEQFKETYHAHKIMQKSSSRYVSELAQLRKTADEIIALIWDDVEKTFANLPEDLRREKCNEYGLVYVFRKNELSRISLPFTKAVPSLFDSIL